MTIWTGYIRSAGLNPHSLWYDDLWVAAVVKLDSLFEAVSLQVPAPPAFIGALWFLRRLVPDPELSLQLVPFCASLAVIPLLAVVVATISKSRSLGVVAGSLMALSPNVAYYSVFVKQYTVDVLAIAGLLLMAVCFFRSREIRYLRLGAGLSVVSLLFSFPSVFAGVVFVNLAALMQLHATDPHDPYTPRSPFREQFVRSQEFPELVRVRNILGRHLTPEEAESVRIELTSLYDAEIAFNDHHFGRLVMWLQEHDLYDSTLIVVTSDHGEEFLDHQQWGHGGTLYQEQLAVPLVIKLPQQAAAGTVVEDLAQHVDLLPTILELAGVEPPATAQGRDLLGPVPTSPDGTSSIQAVSFLNLDGRHAESLRVGWHKAIRYLTPVGTVSRADVFDLETDPGEENNGALSRAVLRGYLEVELDRSILAQPSLLAAEEGVLDPELEERLRALGYLR